MSIALVAAVVRNERRLRLVFTNTLAAGGLTTAPYAVTSLDGRGTNPNVLAAIPVPSHGNDVELVLDTDLVGGAIYQIACTAVPAIDSSTFTGTSAINTAGVTVETNAEPIRDDLDELLFGTDLVHDGLDYVEDPSGDLASISGLPNAKGAIVRTVLYDPLPWDGTYGANSGEYVDAPIPMAVTLRGQALDAISRDPRVSKATAQMVENNDGSVNIAASVYFRGHDQPVGISETVVRSDGG